MLKLCRVTKVKVLFLVLVYVFNVNLFEFSAVFLEKGLLGPCLVDFVSRLSSTERKAPMFGRSEYMIDQCFSFTLTTLQVARNISSLKEHLNKISNN